MLHRWLHRLRVVAESGSSGQGLALIILVAVVTIAVVLLLGTQIAGLLHTVISPCPFGTCR